MRTEYEIRNFVIGNEGSKERRWLKCDEEIKRLKGDPWTEEVVNDMTGVVTKTERLGKTTPEIEILKTIRNELGGPYSPEQIEAAEPAHWRDVLQKQAMYELNALGRISVETQRKALACGVGLAPDKDYIRKVEERFVESCRIKIMVCIPAAAQQHELEQTDDGRFTFREFEHLYTHLHSRPEFLFERQVFCGFPTDHAYNTAVNWCFDHNADFMLCIEDDHRIPADAFIKLMDIYREQGPKAIVAAWYRQRQGGHAGTPIVLKEGQRGYLEADDRVHECWVVPQGFTLIPMAIFREIPYPWFKTTPLLTQDSFFCQLAREAGYKLWCDTSVRLDHIDRKTGKIV